ncbi:MAG: ribonuclease III [Chloroflexi bacterium]|nr:ribonuclease III [Chloroflexota bacterium]
MPDLQNLQERLRVKFKDISLLQLALVHRSYVHENPGQPQGTNERLEFLGDAILGSATADKLYRQHADLSEGELTQLRSALVRQETLARVALSLGLGQFLYLGRGEEISGGRKRHRNLACALEAVIGAVFLDQGHQAAQRLVMRLLKGELERTLREWDVEDYKSLLQMEAQARWRLNPVYRVVKTSGLPHERQFSVEVRAGDKVKGTGRGKSRKVAEKAAAKAALKRVKIQAAT